MLTHTRILIDGFVPMTSTSPLYGYHVRSRVSWHPAHSRTPPTLDRKLRRNWPVLPGQAFLSWAWRMGDAGHTATTFATLFHFSEFENGFARTSAAWRMDETYTNLKCLMLRDASCWAATRLNRCHSMTFSPPNHLCLTLCALHTTSATGRCAERAKDAAAWALPGWVWPKWARWGISKSVDVFWLGVGSSLVDKTKDKALVSSSFRSSAAQLMFSWFS